MAERRPVIVTFKPKDERPDKDRDKLAILTEVTESAVEVFDANRLALGAAIPPAVPAENLAYDVNQYEAPIVTASLTASEIKALKGNDNVAEVEDDGEIYALGAATPWSAGASLQQGEIAVEGQPSPQAETLPAGVNQIKAPQGWGCSQGKNIRVAILDTGIDKNHPDIKPNYKGGVSFVAGEGTPEDFNGHGTHCAGTVAAAINGSGVIGVAPMASLYAVKVLDGSGSGAWSNLIAGIDWGIQNKVRILSMSLGASQAPNAVKTICQTAWNKGLLLVAAAGNDGPADNTVGFPAKYDTVIAVSAIDSANAIANFSSRGADIELCAPGVNVLSTLPGGAFGKLSGTSMACPHVSGAAALAWGGHRYADNVVIRRLLAWRSDPLGIPGRDKLFGYGRVDAAQSACSLADPPAIPGIP
jgi:subtilisin